MYSISKRSFPHNYFTFVTIIQLAVEFMMLSSSANKGTYHIIDENNYSYYFYQFVDRLINNLETADDTFHVVYFIVIINDKRFPIITCQKSNITRFYTTVFASSCFRRKIWFLPEVIVFQTAF